MSLTNIQLEILETLRNGSMPRDEVVKILAKPRTTVFNNLEKLERYGLVNREQEPATKKRGRPKVLWVKTEKREMIKQINEIQIRILRNELEAYIT